MASESLLQWGRTLPFLIIAYMLGLAALRLSFSPFLEVDEAQFVGHVDFRLVYENSHPPLYNWLVRIALEITGWEWSQAVSLVKYGALGAYHLLIWKTTRRLVDEKTALVAVCASAFLPQVVWMSAHTLSHSILVLAGAAATAHAMLRALQEPTWKSFLWLAIAAAVGSLAKYNFFLFLIPLLVVVFADPAMRKRLLRREGLVAVVVYVALVGPTLVAATMEWAASTERVAKLYRADADLAWFDLPYLGIEG